MISYDEALSRIALLAADTGIETVALRDALGRTLASDLDARIPSPPFTNSAMDGYAFRFSDLSERPLEIGARLLAGPSTMHNPIPMPISGGCARINTGAILPEWADTVVPHERVELIGANKLRVKGSLNQGDNIRILGEDVPEGAPLLAAGTQITPETVMIMTAFGYDQARVFQQPELIICTSGDEVVEPGEPLAHGSVYNSNRLYLLAAAQKTGLKKCTETHIPDDLQKAREILTDLTSEPKPQLIVSAGAVSAGDRDHIPHLARDLGFETIFHKVAIRPGKPVMLARRGQQIWLGLPGNPLAVCTGWYYFARPLLAAMAGIPQPNKRLVTLAEDVTKPESLRCFFRGTLKGDSVTVGRAQGSAHFAASISSNTYVELPEGFSLIPAKTEVSALTL